MQHGPTYFDIGSKHANTWIDFLHADRCVYERAPLTKDASIVAVGAKILTLAVRRTP